MLSSYILTQSFCTPSAHSGIHLHDLLLSISSIGAVTELSQGAGLTSTKDAQPGPRNRRTEASTGIKDAMASRANRILKPASSQLLYHTDFAGDCSGVYLCLPSIEGIRDCHKKSISCQDRTRRRPTCSSAQNASHVMSRGGLHWILTVGTYSRTPCCLI